MNGQELLESLGNIRLEFYNEAENAAFPRARRRFRKPLLMAAIIAMMLMLAGCAAVYVLHLQDMKLDEAFHTQNFDAYGQRVEPTQVEEMVIALHGRNDNPVHQAAREWYEYTRSLPEDLWMENNLNEKGFPENYVYTYQCYTQEMVDKLDEIAAAYNLKLLGKPALAQRWQNRVMLDALGLDGICTGHADYLSGMFYPNGNFELYANLKKEQWALPVDVSCRFFYAQNDYFDPAYHSVFLDQEQWNYTTRDGTEVLLVMGEMGGCIFADRGDAFLSILASGMYPDVILRDGDVPFTREAMEKIADAFDYQVRPQSVDMAAVQPRLDAAEAEYQAQQPVCEEPVYADYGELLNSMQWLDTLYYALADLTGDGVEELLLGDGSGTFQTVYTIRDGQTAYLMGDSGEDFRLCENGNLEVHFDSAESVREAYWFSKWNGSEFHTEVHLEYSADGWSTGDYPMEAISEDEAQAIRSKFVPAELEWKSVLSYPMGETTLAQIVREQDPRLTEQEIVRRYAAFIPGYRSIFPLKYFALRDVNGDGVTDLLLSDDTQSICEIWTLNRGRMDSLLYSRVYLCEDDVLETSNPYFRADLGGEWDNHSYGTLEKNRYLSLEKVRHCVTDGTWGLGDDGPEITQEDANGILSKYHRIDPAMKPLGELVRGQ